MKSNERLCFDHLHYRHMERQDVMYDGLYMDLESGPIPGGPNE